MKNLLSAALLLATLSAYAQEQQPKRMIEFYVNTGAAYQLNSGDITEDIGYGSNTVKVPDNVGGYIGGEYYRKNRSGLVTSATLDFKVIPQKLQVYYNAADAGYNSGLTATEEYSFTNTFITPGIKIGYSFNAGAKSSLDITCGIATNFALNGRQHDEIILLDVDNETTHPEVAVSANTKWGNSNNDLMVNNMALLQCTWHTTIGKTRMQAGINFSSSIGFRPSSSDINLAAVNFYGPGRRDAGYVTTEDKFRALSFFIGVGL